MDKIVKSWGLFLPLSLYLIFPFVYIYAKKGFMFGPALFLVGASMTLSGIVLSSIYFTRWHKRIPFNFEDKIHLFIVTVCGISSYVFLYWALSNGSVGKVSIVLLSIPFFTVLIEYLRGLTVITPKKLLGIIIGLCGILPVLLYNSPSDASFILDWNEISVLTFSLLYATAAVSLKHLLIKGHSSQHINGLRMLMGGVLILAISKFFENWSGLKPAVTSWNLFLLYIVIVSVIYSVCFMFYGFLLKHYSAGLVSFCSFINPLIAMIYASVLLSETVSWIFFPSLGIISVGLYIFYKEEMRLKAESTGT